MRSVSRRLMSTASRAGEYLDRESRREMINFIRSRQNPDGGFCGRDAQSDLYHTFFAVSCLRALRQRVRIFRLWKFLRSYGRGNDLDFVHLACLVRLRSGFPMFGRTRRAFFQFLEKKFRLQETAYNAFLMMLVCEDLEREFPLHKIWPIRRDDPTPNVAAAVILNGRQDAQTAELLMKRHCGSGGFCAGAGVTVPDLLSTGVALFALRSMEVSLEDIRDTDLEFVESLWRASGGFSGYAADVYEDCEYTFYGLLSIGCLME